MTKETKVGLLVGLAFIILFAIILSEKGATTNVSGTSTMTVADAGQAGGSLLPRSTTPLAGDGKMPIERALPPATETRTVHRSEPVIPERQVGVPIPKSQDDVQPLPPSVVKTLNYTPIPERQIALSDVGSTPSRKSGLPSGVAKVLGHEQPETQFAAAGRSDDSTDRRVANRPIQRQLRQVEVKPPRIIAMHKVESGESLGKIAAKYYGRSTPSRVNAIFDVNRDKLTSVHAVRIGDVLKIPAIPDADGMSFEPAKEFTGATVVNAQQHRDDEVRIPLSIDSKQDAQPGNDTNHDSDTAPIEFKWYEVRENDTLSRIAQQQMGSARLYLKLYDLNRDLLPNKNSIKPGMKIRIPVIRADEQFSSNHFPRSRRDGASQ